MTLLITIPEEFEYHYNADRFEDSLYRLAADAHRLAGMYEKETAEMLIESFKASIRIPPHGRWISVTERLPEEDGDYLVWYLIEDGGEPCFGILPFDSNVPAFGYWDEYYDPVTYGWAGSDFIEVKGVTHWMPLPEPPKEE